MVARRWLPNQHGAWAFVVVPIVVSALLSRATVMHGVLLAGWVSAYCTSFYMGQAVKQRARDGAWRRSAHQIATFSVVAAMCAAIVASAQPDALRVAPFLVGAFAVNLLSIAGRRERAWLNDVAGIAASLAAGAVGYRLGGEPWSSAVRPTVVLLAYFVGTVFYVKTMIRERGSVTVLRASWVWHACAVAVAGAVMPETVPVLGMALARAVIVPRQRATPKQVGVGEIVVTLALVAAIAWAGR